MAQFEVDEVTQDLEKMDFHHPYTPYDVQEQFMKAVYDVLETGNGQVGILESPTGTVSPPEAKEILLSRLDDI